MTRLVSIPAEPGTAPDLPRGWRRHHTRPVSVLPALCVLFLAASCAHPRRASQPVRFTGADVADDSTGLVITADPDGSALVVGSARFGYFMALPYSRDWAFTSAGEGGVEGRSGSLHLSIELARSDAAPDDVLESMRAQMTQPGRLPGLESAEIVRSTSGHLLRRESSVEGFASATGQAPGALRGGWQLGLIAARRSGGRVATCRLSRTAATKREMEEAEPLLRRFANTCELR